MRILFTFLFFVLSFAINLNAQNNGKYIGLWMEKSSIYSGKNLNDSVKTVYFKLNKPKQSLSDSDKDYFILYNDIRNFIYLNIDNYGRIKSELGQGGLTGDAYLSNIDYKKTNDYIYDDKDWIAKSNYKTTLKQYFPVSNNNLLLKLNRSEVEKKTIKIGGKIWHQFSKYVYVYTFDEFGKVKEEQEFLIHRTGELIIDTIQKKEDLFSRKIFTYNAKGQVANQKIIAGTYAKQKGRSYSDLGTEISFCNDLQLKYFYDQSGRIIQVVMYGCGEVAAKEEYTYHPTKDYVEKVKCFVTGPGEISNPTKKFIKTYNEEGDIIKKEFVPDNPEQNLKVKTRYYTYQYDSHNNWIKCNMFLEGTPDGEPTLVAERKIEYYN
ncbi:hypothetical protein N4T20_10355 [Flavobacterium sp. TR2]|uniref:hypothetical protein n=1 Tax=Flavobacterium sp. TR2 TaxID=2977321 RepID=UPI0021B13003|nr:hypothetical protein [Flavobacterium sp. TR2]UWY30317.1 hypothetical protein N4T20_10355 [Flavobacterium sp. TR2]